MSPGRSDLRSRMTTAATRRAEPDAPAAGKTAIRTKPARVTLNLPPELYRQPARWTDSAAEAIDVPRVGVREALRAMVRDITDGKTRTAEQQVLAAIREELHG
jgi:hypothetical protein